MVKLYKWKCACGTIWNVKMGQNLHCPICGFCPAQYGKPLIFDKSMEYKKTKK